jgi:hypothetical protein
MATPDAGIQAQIRNIEATYGRSLHEWFDVIDTSGATKHTDIVAMLKDGHGMTHGAAHRVALLARQRDTQPSGAQHLAELYSGRKAGLRPIHDRIIAIIDGFGGAESVPKKGYVSLRRAKQFAMIKPSTATRVDLGLILPGRAATERLESAQTFNALFTHRVRLTTAAEVDEDVVRWLHDAYERAGER